MFNSSPYSVNTSRTNFNMTPVKNPLRKNERFSIERDHSANTYIALLGKNSAPSATGLALTDIHGIANQIPEFGKPAARTPKNGLDDDLNTKFFVISVTALGLLLFYNMSMKY